MDTCSSVPCTDDLSVHEKLDALKKVSAPDGVHLNQTGYMTMAENIVECLERLKAGKSARSAAVALSGPRRMHVWHGFCSPVGSKQSRVFAEAGKAHRERQRQQYLPYHRWGKRGKH
jgi:hypothetical protein